MLQNGTVGKRHLSMCLSDGPAQERRGGREGCELGSEQIAAPSSGRQATAGIPKRPLRDDPVIGRLATSP